MVTGRSPLYEQLFWPFSNALTREAFDLARTRSSRSLIRPVGAEFGQRTAQWRLKHGRAVDVPSYFAELSTRQRSARRKSEGSHRKRKNSWTSGIPTALEVIRRFGEKLCAVTGACTPPIRPCRRVGRFWTV